jgi:hypothetical protein
MKEDAMQMLRMAYDNLKWFRDNYDRLKKQYDDKWVAVKDKKVIASGNSFENVVTSLKESDRRHAIVEYMQSEHTDMMF